MTYPFKVGDRVRRRADDTRPLVPDLLDIIGTKILIISEVLQKDELLKFDSQPFAWYADRFELVVSTIIEITDNSGSVVLDDGRVVTYTVNDRPIRADDIVQIRMSSTIAGTKWKVLTVHEDFAFIHEGKRCLSVRLESLKRYVDA